MKAPLLLRIAAVLTFLYFAGHTSGIPWTPAVGPAEAPVIEAMKSHPFNAMGSTRTYWNFYVGFGIIISGYLLIQSVMLWQLGSLAKTDTNRVRPIITSFFVGSITTSVLAWRYFFILPVIMTVAISMCLALAFVAAGRSNPSQPATPADGP